MKKICVFSVLLSMLLILVGCQEKETDFAYTTTEISDDPLVICVDIEGSGGNIVIREKAMNELMYSLEHTAGLTDAAVLFIPPSGTERKTYIDRLRVEIMAGGGPDVFLMAYHSGFDEGSDLNLFEYPQKVMEAGLFLPLDEYMENHTQFTEWDKQTQGVMAAGRNEEGQQIIPLSYSLPVICYPKSMVDYTPTRELSWNDMLTDPELSPYALDLANCFDWEPDTEGWNGVTRYYMEYILGELADFEQEELLFTEEELLQRVNEILALDTDDANDDLNDKYNGAIEEWVGLGLSARSYNKPITMIPMYSDDGGVTATISAYAAINRNTTRPEEAFAVIDLLMSEKVQVDHHFYSSYIYGALRALPMHEELFQEETASGGSGYYLTDENFQELCEVRDQITGANFGGRYREVLNEMLLIRCRNAQADGTTVEELVHEVYEDLQRRVRE